MGPWRGCRDGNSGGGGAGVEATSVRGKRRRQGVARATTATARAGFRQRFAIWCGAAWCSSRQQAERAQPAENASWRRPVDFTRWSCGAGRMRIIGLLGDALGDLVADHAVGSVTL